jgi:hypothetical protein
VEARFGFAGGKPLRDLDRAHASPNGLVMASSKVVPPYPRTRAKVTVTSSATTPP